MSDELRRHGEVKDAAAGDAELLIDGGELGLELGVGGGSPKLPGTKKRLREKSAQWLSSSAWREKWLMPSRARLRMYSSGSTAVGVLGAGQAETDDGEVRRQHAVHVEVVDGGQQFAPGEIAVAAEDDEDARLRKESLLVCHKGTSRSDAVGGLV